MGITAKITSKGQVTIPRAMRRHLGTRMVEFEVDGENVVLKPVKSVAGILKRCADPEKIPLEAHAWSDGAREEHEDP